MQRLRPYSAKSFIFSIKQKTKILANIHNGKIKINNLISSRMNFSEIWSMRKTHTIIIFDCILILNSELFWY
jgi:hypothetical protein